MNIYIYVIQGKNNISIKIFRLLPLSIHVNLSNLSIIHKIMSIQNMITATKRQDTIYNRKQNININNLYIYIYIYIYICICICIL